MKINFPTLFQTSLNKYKVFFIFGNDPIVRERAILFIQKQFALPLKIQADTDISKAFPDQISLFEDQALPFLTLVHNVTDKILGCLPQLREGVFIFTSEKARAGSKLVNHFTADANSLAIAAYEAPLIQREFHALIQGMDLAPPFQESLFKSYLNNFHGFLATLEKIKLFGDISPEQQELFLESPTSSADLAPLLEAFLVKDSKRAAQAINALASDETIAVLRALSRSFMTLFDLTRFREAKMAINWQKLSPPVFFKEQPLFEAALLKWKPKEIQDFLKTLLFLEEKVKYSSYGSSQVGQALLGIW
jgi:DNA polymerase III delta subunit